MPGQYGEHRLAIEEAVSRDEPSEKVCTRWGATPSSTTAGVLVEDRLGLDGR